MGRGGCESKTPFWMYWQESIGRSETESFRDFIVDLCCGKTLVLETMKTEDEGILISFVYEVYTSVCVFVF